MNQARTCLALRTRWGMLELMEIRLSIRDDQRLRQGTEIDDFSMTLRGHPHET